MGGGAGDAISVGEEGEGTGLADKRRGMGG